MGIPLIYSLELADLDKYNVRLDSRKYKFWCNHNCMSVDFEQVEECKYSYIYMCTMLHPNTATDYMSYSKLAYIDMLLGFAYILGHMIAYTYKNKLSSPNIPNDYKFCCILAYIGKL